jgi:heat shock protein HslJ
MKKIHVFLAIFAFAIISCNNKTADKVSDMEMDSSVTMDGTMMMTDSIEVVNDTTNSDVLNNVDESKTVKTNNPADGKYALSETNWKLVQLNGKEVPTNGKENILNLDSKSGTFTAFAGCNNLRGSYTMVKSTKLTFAKIISTKMACQNGNKEAEFIQTLEKTQTYTVNDDVLLLYNGKKEIAKFVIK